MDETIGTAISGVHPIHADAEAFERALEAQYLELLRLAVLMAHDQREAEDALQSAMERAWRARAQIRDPAVLDPWLRRIVVREVVRRQMSRWRRLVRPATPIDLYPMVVVGIGPDLRIQLLEALARLSAPQRAVIVLHHYAGYRIEEVSAMVGAPIETVRSRLRLGMAALRAELVP